MKEKEQLGDSPAIDISDKIGSASGNSLASEEKKPTLSQRMTEAFREGIACANPDNEKRPEAKTPPPSKNSPQESSDGGILNRVIQEGGSAAAAVGDKAASALGDFIQLVKKAPVLTQKYKEAFREGAASMKSREGGKQREEAPTATKKKGMPSNGEMIMDRVFQAGESAAGFVREAIAVVNPGELIGAGQKIRVGKKKINDLYIDIGSEVVNSWSNGLVETEKLAALLDELRKNEEEILSLQERLAEVAAAKKAAAAKRPQTVKQEAAFTPATDKEDSRADTDVSGAKPDKPVDDSRDMPRSENAHGVEEISVSAVPDSESPESRSVSEGTVNATAAPQEEASAGTDRAMPEEPEVSQEKTEADPPGAGAARHTSRIKRGKRDSSGHKGGGKAV